MGYRLGVDVGGTFTDLLLIDEASAQEFRTKVPTTAPDPSVGVLSGIAKICDLAGIRPGEITDLMHGTTVATNVVLERKGARVGLVTTAGYRQVLQIARSFVPGGLAGWIVWPKPQPLAALEDTVEIKERIGARGDVVEPLDEASARVALAKLERQQVQAVAVSLINSYANPAHERRVGELATAGLRDVPISLSSEILPEMREYERAITTVANSYVGPAVAGYLRNLERELRTQAVDAHLKLLRSDGGLTTFDGASRAPVNTILSGPAGGVAGAASLARLAGFENVLTLDMGGTSTDVALIEGGSPRLRRETMVGDVTVRVSSLDVRSIGAGGGSIARVPELTRALRVGPQSAGTEPGPAAYGKGGTEPTVTDAYVVLGYLPHGLLGGEMKLDGEAARAAVQKVADALGVTLFEAAAGIIDLVNENMFGALRVVSVERGYDPREFALFAFGGAGPMHANALGRLLGSWPVIIPPSPGVLCAYGDATTRMRHEAASTFIRSFSETSAREVEAALRELAETAARVLDSEGVARSDQEAGYEIDVRYRGQGFETPVPVTVEDLAREGLPTVGRAFDDIHRRLFTFALDTEHEIVNLRAAVQGKAPAVKARTLLEGGTDCGQARVGRTEISADGHRVEATVYERARLKAGNRIVGPAIVYEMDSTTLILPGHAGTVHPSGSILIRPLSS